MNPAGRGDTIQPMMGDFLVCSLRVGWGCGSAFVKCLGSPEETHPKQPALLLVQGDD